MRNWKGGPARIVWHDPEEVAAARAAIAFLEWWKPLLQRPLHDLRDFPDDLSIAGSMVLMSLAWARRHPRLEERGREFRQAREYVAECRRLLRTPQARRLASAEELARGRQLLAAVLPLLNRLIRAPPSWPSPFAPRPSPYPFPFPQSLAFAFAFAFVRSS